LPAERVFLFELRQQDFAIALAWFGKIGW